MDFIQLNYFVTTVEVHNTMRAADLLHISQPALSKALARMEAELGGVKLFRRNGRQNELTACGKLFYDWAKQTLGQYDAVQRSLETAQAEEASRITIAISGINFTAPIISSFRKANANIQIREVPFTRAEFPSIIYDPDIDCVLSGRAHNSPKAHQHLISRSPLYLLVPPDSPFASRTRMSLTEAENEYFVIAISTSLFSETLNEVFQHAGFSPKIAAEADRNHILQMVHDGIGVAVCSDTAFFRNQKECPRILLDDPFCYRDTYLQWVERETCTSALRAFLDFVIAQTDQHL